VATTGLVLVRFESDGGEQYWPQLLSGLHRRDPRRSTGHKATDWPQIVALYELLLRIADNPAVRLDHAVAVAMVQGPRAGLELVDELQADDRIAADHRLHAVRGHLLEMAGECAAARDSYLAAARRTTSLPRQRYLHAQAARLADDQ
jgi:predicted RNA polymerase sigma factor